MGEADYEHGGRMAALRAEWVFDPTSSARPLWSHPAGLALTWIEGSGAAPEGRMWLLTVFAFPAGTGMLAREWLAGECPAVPVTNPEAPPEDAWRLPDDVLEAADLWLCAGSAVGHEWSAHRGAVVGSFLQHAGCALGVDRTYERMNRVLRLRVTDVLNRGPRTRATDAGPSAFDAAPPAPTGFDDQPEVREDPLWVGRLSVREREVYDGIREGLRPTIHRIVQGNTTVGDAYRVLVMVHEAKTEAVASKPAPAPEPVSEPEPVTSWWGAVVHRHAGEALTITTYGRCSWETTPAGPALRVEVPALSFPADEPSPGIHARPAWDIPACVTHIPFANVAYYAENTEEVVRTAYAAEMDATRIPKWVGLGLFP